MLGLCCLVWFSCEFIVSFHLLYLKKSKSQESLLLPWLRLQEQLYHANSCSGAAEGLCSRFTQWFLDVTWLTVMSELDDLTRPPVTVLCLYLQADNDHIMGFHQCFFLKNTGGDSWVCTNDMFRLAIHNFG